MDPVTHRGPTRHQARAPCFQSGKAVRHVNEEIMLREIESLNVLSENARKVAIWLAMPVLNPMQDRPTLRAMALENNIPVGSAYRLAQTENVMDAARDLIKASVQAEKVPILWSIVFEKASRSADFALKVLKQLDDMGVDIYLGKKNADSGPEKLASVTLTAPGDLEAAIFAIRGAQRGTDDAG